MGFDNIEGTTSNYFAVGNQKQNGTPIDIIANTNSTNKPKLRFDVISSKWKFTNDGLTYTDIGSGGSGNGGGYDNGTATRMQEKFSNTYSISGDPIGLNNPQETYIQEAICYFDIPTSLTSKMQNYKADAYGIAFINKDSTNCYALFNIGSPLSNNQITQMITFDKCNVYHLFQANLKLYAITDNGIYVFAKSNTTNIFSIERNISYLNGKYAINYDGYLFITNPTDGCIANLDLNSGVSTPVSIYQNANIQKNITIDDDGYIWISTSDNKLIKLRFDKSANTLTEEASYNSLYFATSNIVCDGKNIFYINSTNSCIIKFEIVAKSFTTLAVNDTFSAKSKIKFFDNAIFTFSDLNINKYNPQSLECLYTLSLAIPLQVNRVTYTTYFQAVDADACNDAFIIAYNCHPDGGPYDFFAIMEFCRSLSRGAFRDILTSHVRAESTDLKLSSNQNINITSSNSINLNAGNSKTINLNNNTNISGNTTFQSGIITLNNDLSDTGNSANFLGIRSSDNKLITVPTPSSQFGDDGVATKMSNKFAANYKFGSGLLMASDTSEVAQSGVCYYNIRHSLSGKNDGYGFVFTANNATNTILNVNSTYLIDSYSNLQRITLPLSTIYKIIQSESRIFAISDNGIYYFSKATNDGYLIFEGTISGIFSDATYIGSTIFASKASNNYVYIFDANTLSGNDYQIDTALTKIIIDGEGYIWGIDTNNYLVKYDFNERDFNDYSSGVFKLIKSLDIGTNVASIISDGKYVYVLKLTDPSSVLKIDIKTYETWEVILSTTCNSYSKLKFDGSNIIVYSPDRIIILDPETLTILQTLYLVIPMKIGGNNYTVTFNCRDIDYDSTNKILTGFANLHCVGVSTFDMWGIFQITNQDIFKIVDTLYTSNIKLNKTYQSGTNVLVLNPDSTVGINNNIGSTIVISPATLSTDTNDYNPIDQGSSNNLSNATILRLSSNTSVNITGLVAQSNQMLKQIFNVGSSNIVLQHQNNGSQSANQFTIQGAADLTLEPNDTVGIFYDGISSTWRLY